MASTVDAVRTQARRLGYTLSRRRERYVLYDPVKGEWVSTAGEPMTLGEVEACLARIARQRARGPVDGAPEGR
jgi:hypothetical protein